MWIDIVFAVALIIAVVKVAMWGIVMALFSSACNMIQLYKHQKLRHVLISKGREQVSPLSEAVAKERLWNYIRQAVTT